MIVETARWYNYKTLSKWTIFVTQLVNPLTLIRSFSVYNSDFSSLRITAPTQTVRMGVFQNYTNVHQGDREVFFQNFIFGKIIVKNFIQLKRFYSFWIMLIKLIQFISRLPFKNLELKGKIIQFYVPIEEVRMLRTVARFSKATSHYFIFRFVIIFNRKCRYKFFD